MTHSSCSLPTCLCLSEKRNKLRLFCGAQVFFFPLLLSSVTRTSRSLPACLRLTEKRWKIAPVLQIQASSMKLRVHGFLFLVSFSIRGCSILLLKKRKRALRPDSFFFNDSDIFKNILILIITSLAIHYSQNVFRGFSILVCKGVQVYFRGFIFHSSSRTWLALALAARLPPFDQKKKTVKNCACSADPGLLNETKDSWFPLSCLSSFQNKWSKQTFFYNDINI